MMKQFIQQAPAIFLQSTVKISHTPAKLFQGAACLPTVNKLSNGNALKITNLSMALLKRKNSNEHILACSDL